MRTGEAQSGSSALAMNVRAIARRRDATWGCEESSASTSSTSDSCVSRPAGPAWTDAASSAWQASCNVRTGVEGRGTMASHGQPLRSRAISCPVAGGGWSSTTAARDGGARINAGTREAGKAGEAGVAEEARVSERGRERGAGRQTEGREEACGRRVRTGPTLVGAAQRGGVRTVGEVARLADAGSERRVRHQYEVWSAESVGRGGVELRGWQRTEVQRGVDPPLLEPSATKGLGEDSGEG